MPARVADFPAAWKRWGKKDWAGLFDDAITLADQGFPVSPRLAGLIKHTLRRKQGVADLERLAASSAQRITAVREGIYVLAARGDVQIVQEEETSMQLIPGDGEPRPELPETQARFRAILQETAAYRAYFARTAPERLV